MKVTSELLAKLPPYIRIDNGCAMRLMGDKDHGGTHTVRYYRDGGAWGYDNFRVEEDGRIFGLFGGEHYEYLNNREFHPISYKEWFEDNGRYVTSDMRGYPNENVKTYNCCEDHEKNGMSWFCKTCNSPIGY